MTIKVVCQCGATFGAKDEMAGRKVACPKCKQPLQIGGAPAAAAPTPAPAGGGISDLLDEVGFDNVQGPRCPKCAKAVQPTAMLCVNCGFNLQTGENVVGAVIQTRSEVEGDKKVAETLLSSAAERIADAKLEDKKTRSQGAPVWVYFIAFVGVLAFVACMLMMPRDDAFRINGIGLVVFGSFMIFIYGVRMIISAFYEDMTQGFLMFVPFYSFYYLATRWSRVSGLFMLQLLGCGFIALGLGMIAISPFMAIKEEDGLETVDRQKPPAAFVAHLEPEQLRDLSLPFERLLERTGFGV